MQLLYLCAPGLVRNICLLVVVGSSSYVGGSLGQKLGLSVKMHLIVITDVYLLVREALKGKELMKVFSALSNNIKRVNTMLKATQYSKANAIVAANVV